ETGAAPQPVAPKPLLNIAIAIVLGGMVGVGIAFLLEYLDNTIRSDEDIEKQLGLPILGVISHMEDDDFPPQKMTINQKKSTKGGITRAQHHPISNTQAAHYTHESTFADFSALSNRSDAFAIRSCRRCPTIPTHHLIQYGRRKTDAGSDR